MKSSKEIRQDFIDFFKNKGHKEVKSAPVIPQKDPTLLFTNAGMNQFKSIFLGKEEPIAERVVDYQKCIRVSGKHNDLEEVGRDTYHHTFFEMLGNWSFGDYYKKEAIQYAWELLTEIWELSQDRLWATVYKDDDEAAELWSKVTDIEKDRILRFGEKDNFWEMGDTGPCGPCSEVHIYIGNEPANQTAQKVNADDPEYIELWNLVFIQYNRDRDGELNPLPVKHVDTGAGLERLVAVLQGERSNYATDLFMPIINKISALTGVEYSEKDGTAHRVIADHMRMLSVSLADGALPSNEGRGYVLRRVLRRASRYARILEVHEPVLYKLVDVVAEVLGAAYPEIIDRKKHIKKVIKVEEESFGKTLDRGLEVFHQYKDEVEAAGKKVIPGKKVFKLYDTYGFPVDLTNLLAEEEGLEIDEQGFEKQMQKQREQARQEGGFYSDYNEDLDWQSLTEGEDSEFVGYEQEKINAQIRKFARDDEGVKIVLDRTPFYAESGGEVGDTGFIYNKNLKIRIKNAIRVNQSIIHSGRILEGEIANPKVIAEIDSEKNNSIRANHTATHLLHAALREVLGDHVTQAGSLVDASHLRFDLTHYEKMSQKELDKVEDIVNAKIRENIKLEVEHKAYDEAREEGAMALFGEKYDDVVRVVTVEDFSQELCGGKHAERTGDLGLFKITMETSVASGVRRIEAVTGKQAFELLRQDEKIINELEEATKTPRDKFLQEFQKLSEQIKDLQKKTKELEAKNWEARLDEIINNAKKIDGISLIAQEVPDKEIDDLKEIADIVRKKIDTGIGVLVSAREGKPGLVVVISDKAREKYELKAGDIALELGKILGGGGGGRPHMATAGGSHPDKIQAMLDQLPKIIKSKL
ncbi:MAG: alanine--tRNA ligase [Candidatus Marinimicrobia bacterium]|nr:alanine--tRNA ligase [Candidatus Neomarinimicrobiota bacterium]